MNVVTYYILAFIGHVNELNWLIPSKVFDTIWENCLFLPREGNKDIFFSSTAICFLCLEIFMWKLHTPWAFWQIVLAELIRDLEEFIKWKSQEKVAFSIVGQESYKSNLWSPVLGVTLSGPRITHISQIPLHCNQSH